MITSFLVNKLIHFINKNHKVLIKPPEDNKHFNTHYFIGVDNGNSISYSYIEEGTSFVKVKEDVQDARYSRYSG